MNFDQYAQKIYKQNKEVGWWDDPNRCLYECLQLVSTEVAEATEAERKDLMDDHLPHRKGGEVELADALIRVLDLGAHLGRCHVSVPCVPFAIGNWSIGRRHWWINSCLTDFEDAALGGVVVSLEADDSYSRLIQSICMVAHSMRYDIEGAMLEKLEYNRKRQDHKREERAKAGGKKF